MLAASIIAIFLIPVTYYVVESLVHRGGRPATEAAKVLAPDMLAKTGDGDLSRKATQPVLSPPHAHEGEGYEGGH
jgi:hypothetical protein